MALALRSSALVAPSRPALRTQTVRRPMSVRAMATPSKQNVETAIKDAEEICADGKAKDCAVAWDTVEELSAAADKQRKNEVYTDPLEKFCETAPDADECRVYED